ncbi:MAG: hypothetical protein SFU25_10285 [Candidatus Caenarcaniphilales bacterium]|nr:hypothetical protein [Candidatus Caenarcaniphilales bacterium]
MIKPMIDPDYLVVQRWINDLEGPRSSRALSNNIRQDNKIVLEATNQSVNYVTQRNRLGSSFESLFRAVGLGAGVVFGGPIGAATLSSISGGVGRGLGEYMGNRIYGKTIYDLDQVITNNKYKQLINNYALSKVNSNISLIDQFHKQATEEIDQTIQGLNQQ